MSAGIPINSARRTVTYTAEQLVDQDGVLESVATETSAHEYVPADFDGAVIAGGGVLNLPRTITITLSDDAGAFATDPIVITGWYGGSEVTESLTPSTNDGNETLVGVQPFSRIASIAVPEQDDTDGSFTVGVQDICAQPGDTFSAVELSDDGQLNVQYGPEHTDSFAVIAGVLKPIAPTRILTSPDLSVPTTVGLTVYLP